MFYYKTLDFFGERNQNEVIGNKPFFVDTVENDNSVCYSINTNVVGLVKQVAEDTVSEYPDDYHDQYVNFVKKIRNILSY